MCATFFLPQYPKTKNGTCHTKWQVPFGLPSQREDPDPLDEPVNIRSPELTFGESQH
jgi:hypothetical protein